MSAIFCRPSFSLFILASRSPRTWIVSVSSLTICSLGFRPCVLNDQTLRIGAVRLGGLITYDHLVDSLGSECLINHLICTCGALSWYFSSGCGSWFCHAIGIVISTAFGLIRGCTFPLTIVQYSLPSFWLWFYCTLSVSEIFCLWLWIVLSIFVVWVKFSWVLVLLCTALFHIFAYWFFFYMHLSRFFMAGSKFKHFSLFVVGLSPICFFAAVCTPKILIFVMRSSFKVSICQFLRRSLQMMLSTDPPIELIPERANAGGFVFVSFRLHWLTPLLHFWN